jgi:hypothetical protein
MRNGGVVPLSRSEVAEWVGRTAAAEVVGMTAAAAAARSADSLLADPSPSRTAAAWVAVVGAGCVEAFAVGIAQSVRCDDVSRDLIAGASCSSLSR